MARGSTSTPVKTLERIDWKGLSSLNDAFRYSAQATINCLGMKDMLRTLNVGETVFYFLPTKAHSRA